MWAGEQIKEKYQKFAIQKLQVRMTKYLMCTYWGHICIFISNMKFLSLILWLGGLCTDANDASTDADDTYTDDDNNYA